MRFRSHRDSCKSAHVTDDILYDAGSGDALKLTQAATGCFGVAEINATGQLWEPLR